uniref:Uncharacterized protein n=1 Tax=Rhizophora mucronata TaxID=61149 RepID=A0A2P2LLV5_RHIMU
MLKNPPWLPKIYSKCFCAYICISLRYSFICLIANEFTILKF